MAKKKTKTKATGKKAAKKRQTKKADRARDIKIDLSQLKFCPDCASGNVFYSQMRDELICRDCGGIFSKLTPEQLKKYKEVSNVL